uniref:Uncharacterized protein n=1 Tax=Arundo donax TaxID=35708 RepID=A0A0A8ZP03_ARUDO
MGFTWCPRTSFPSTTSARGASSSALGPRWIQLDPFTFLSATGSLLWPPAPWRFSTRRH